MSYSTFNEDSDVYVFMSVHGHLECCGCSVTGGFYYAQTTQDMCDHLAKHRKQGDVVPDTLEEELWEDDADNFNEYE